MVFLSWVNPQTFSVYLNRRLSWTLGLLVLVVILVLSGAVHQTVRGQENSTQSAFLEIVRTNDSLIIRNEGNTPADVYDLSFQAFDYEVWIASYFPELAVNDFLLQPGDCISYSILDVSSTIVDCNPYETVTVPRPEVFWAEDIFRVYSDNRFEVQCPLDEVCSVDFTPTRSIYADLSTSSNGLPTGKFIFPTGDCDYQVANNSLIVLSDTEGSCAIALEAGRPLAEFESFGFETVSVSSDSGMVDMKLELYSASGWWTVCGTRYEGGINYAIFEIKPPFEDNVYNVISSEDSNLRFRYRIVNVDSELILECLFNEERIGSVALSDLPIDSSEQVTRIVASSRPEVEVITEFSDVYTWPTELAE